MKPVIRAAAVCRSAFASLLLLAAGFTHAQASPSWSITSLGALGDRGSVAVAINNRGDIAGNSAVNLPGEPRAFTHAFRWQNGVLQDIGQAIGPATINHAQGLNANGTIVGSGPDGAMVWRNGAWMALGFNGSANDINNAGVIVGTESTGTGVQRAVLYRDGVLHDLGSLGGRLSGAVAVNAGGLAVGFSTLPDNITRHAFVYSEGMMKDLGTFGGAGSTAVDVNDRGDILGHAQDANGQWAAFIADASGHLSRLMDFPDHHFTSALNQRGDVVGTTQFNSYLYADGTMTILEQIPEVQAAGWFMLFPMDINDRGWITGWGWSASGPFDGEAFLLKPH